MAADVRPSVIQESDGVLTLGLMVPAQVLDNSQIADLDQISQAIIGDIDAVSTPAGMPVKLVIRTEVGDLGRDRATLDAMITEDGVDAIIGPFASPTVGALAPVAFDAGIGVCSPAAAGIVLDDLPDGGLMIRTRPGDKTVLAGMAKLADAVGFDRAIVLHSDDPYGRAAVAELSEFFAVRGLSQPTDDVEQEQWIFPYTLDSNGVLISDYDPNVIVDRVVVLIANDAAARTLLDTINLSQVVNWVILNDAFVGEQIADPEDGSLSPLLERSYVGAAVDHYAGWSTLISSLSASTPALSQGLAPIPFVTGIADCMNVIALSAIITGSDLASSFMQIATSTTNSGTPCSTLRECLLYIEEGRDIDYQGPTGELSLDDNGDAVTDTLLQYAFGADGRAQVIGTFSIDGE